MPTYVIKGRYDAEQPMVIIPDAAGTPIPIGRARADGQDVRVAPKYIVIQGSLDIPASLAADIGAVELVNEVLAAGAISDGYATPEDAIFDAASGTYVIPAINDRMPEDGKTNATGAQVTAASTAIIAAMVAEQQADVIEDYKTRVIAAALANNIKLTSAQKTALQTGALAALQAAKLCP